MPSESTASRANEPPAAKAVASVEVPPAPPVTSTFTPIGYVEKPGGQLEAIILQDSQVYVVHIGERFADKYRVLKISPDSVEVVEDMPVPPAPLDTKGSDSKVLRADLSRVTLTSDEPDTQKPLASLTAPAESTHAGVVRKESIEPGTLRKQVEAKAAATSNAVAHQPLGYVEKANGHVEAVLADGGTVRLVPQARKEVALQDTVPASVSTVRLMATAAVAPLPQISEQRDMENEIAGTPSTETPTEVPEIPAQTMVGEQPETVSDLTVRRLLDSSEQVLAAPSANLWMNQVRPETNSARISEVESPETPSFSPAHSTTTLKPLGFVERADGELDAVVSKDDDVFVVRQGETFGERFRALRVTRGAVEVAEVSSPQGLGASIPFVLAMPDLMSFDFSASPSLPDLVDLGLESMTENPGNSEAPGTCLALEANPIASSAKSLGSPPRHGVGSGHVQMKSAEVAEPSQEAKTLIFQTLGSIETSNGEIEAIVAGGSEVYLVKQGERFADQYIAISVEAGLVLAVRAPSGNHQEDLLSRRTDSREEPASKKLAMRNHQFCVSDLQAFQEMGASWGTGLTDLGVTLFQSSGFAGYDLQSHLAMADNPHDPF